MEKKALENEEDRKQKKTEKTPSHARWVIRVFLIAVALSASMSLCSGAVLEDAGYVTATLILLLFIALGILESVHGKGTFLISDDLSAFYSNVEEPAPTIDATETMKQILEFRSIVEPAVCAQVAQTASPELIAKLEGYLKTMKASVGKCEEFINADVAFHMEIINACGNAYTIAIMNETFQRRANLGKMLILSTGYYGGIYYHGILLDAFRKHDVKRARVMMEEHLQHGLYDLESDNLGQEKNDL